MLNSLISGMLTESRAESCVNIILGHSCTFERNQSQGIIRLFAPNALKSLYRPFWTLSFSQSQRGEDLIAARPRRRGLKELNRFHALGQRHLLTIGCLRAIAVASPRIRASVTCDKNGRSSVCPSACRSALRNAEISSLAAHSTQSKRGRFGCGP